MLQNSSIKDFISELGSNSPAPGGGSAAALSAALGSALSSMVFNLTVGKKVYNEYDDEKKASILNSLENTDKSSMDFLNLMEKDAEEFLLLMEAFKLPKNTEEEKKLRDEQINLGYNRALEVPLEVARKSFDMFKYIEIAAAYGNKNAISDAGVAALLMQTAIESAVLNVKINLAVLKDEPYKKSIEKECSELILRGSDIKNKIIEIVSSKI
jgi:formiminotetrahydrofolate cyclodeaminase